MGDLRRYALVVENGCRICSGMFSAVEMSRRICSGKSSSVENDVEFVKRHSFIRGQNGLERDLDFVQGF